jgi:cytidine deaminase
MIEKARIAMANAYSPYSHFQVGACIRTANNQLFSGCNNENVSYSLTQCAETTAIGTMITEGEQSIVEVVLIGSSTQPCTPCGACRQRIREFALPETLIHMLGREGEPLTMTLAELLPESFGPALLPTQK